MSKKLFIGIGAFLYLLFCLGCIYGITTASIEVSNTYAIEGVGVVDRTLDIETDSAIAAGQKFSESMFTKGDMTQLNMTQELDTVLDCSDSEIDLYGSFAATNARAQQYLRNYNLGTIHGYEYMGGATKLEYEYAADNFTSGMHLTGESIDKMEYTIKVKELDTHKTLFAESFTMNGYTKYDIDSFVENVSYPAAGEEGDWLGCP